MSDDSQSSLDIILECEKQWEEYYENLVDLYNLKNEYPGDYKCTIHPEYSLGESAVNHELLRQLKNGCYTEILKSHGDQKRDLLSNGVQISSEIVGIKVSIYYRVRQCLQCFFITFTTGDNCISYFEAWWNNRFDERLWSEDAVWASRKEERMDIFRVKISSPDHYEEIQAMLKILL